MRYDKLIVATGARPVRPELSGHDLPNVFLLHTMEDSFAVHRRLEECPCESAVLIGGGYIGLTTWGDLRLTGHWATHPISLFGRNPASGTYDVFAEEVLWGTDFKGEVKQQPGSAEVVKMVAADKYAIGYSGIGYLTDGVRTVPLATTPG